MRKRGMLEDFRVQGARPLRDAILLVAERLGISATRQRSKLEQAWQQAAGPDAAEHSRVVSLRNNTLTVAVDASVWKQEIATLRQQEILESLGKTHKRHSIRRLKVILGESTMFCQDMPKDGH